MPAMTTHEALFGRPVPTMSSAEKMALMSDIERGELLDQFTQDQLAGLAYDWHFWRRPSQRTPEGRWRVWFIRAGRGYGKTRVGSEEVRARVDSGKYGRIAIIGATAGDARDIMVEGESGLLSVFPPHQRPEYEPSKRRVTFHNGAIGTTYSADEPDRLRGPQHDFGWGDEPASWKTGVAAWDNFALGLRLGNDPRCILTGTPRPMPWLRKLSARATTISTVGSTFENLVNLAPPFIEEILAMYEGTTLGRQELHAEWLDDVEGALWVEATIELYRWHDWSIEQHRDWRVVVAVDPPGETAECGISVCAAPPRPDRTSHAVVLDDASMAGRPEQWGAQVVSAWKKWGADKVIVESNQGGDMVRAVIHAVDPMCPVEKVRAVVSKKERAEPVSTLYEKGRVHHLGHLPMLESQMVTWVPDQSKSPDRLDAMVHAINFLLPQVNVTASVTSVASRRIAHH